MAKYFPEPAPFALNEREERLLEYIFREFNRLSDALLKEVEITMEEKFVPPERPQIGMVVFADGVYWNPGAGRGFYGYDGTTWNKLG